MVCPVRGKGHLGRRNSLCKGRERKGSRRKRHYGYIRVELKHRIVGWSWEHRVSDARLWAWEQGQPGAIRVAWRGPTQRLEGGSELGLEQRGGDGTRLREQQGQAGH